jgi:tetratricopeptide (TPR) repeat protein
MEEDSNPDGGNPEVGAAEPVPPAVAPPKPRTRKFSIRKLNARLSLIISLLLKCGGITVVILFASVVYRELSFKGYSLQEIRVPEQLAKDGHTGEAIAASVEAQLQKIKSKVENYDQWDINDGVEAGDYSVAESGDELEVNLVGVGFSMGSVINLVRTSLGIEKNRTVRAYITLDHANVTLTTYIKGQPPQEITIPMDSTGMGATIKTLTLAAAESILKVSNPELLVAYLSIGSRTTEDLKKIIATSQYALANRVDIVRRKYFYAAMGWALLDRRKLAEGVDANEKAIALDPMFITANFGVAVGFGRMRQYETSRTYLRKAIRVVESKGLSEDKISFYRDIFYRNMLSSYWNSHLPDSAMLICKEYLNFLSDKSNAQRANGYNEIAFNYSEQGLYDSAVVNLRKAIISDSSLAITYTTLAEVHGYMKDSEKFYFYLKKAFEKGYSMPTQVEFLAPYSTYRNEKAFRLLWTKYAL